MFDSVLLDEPAGSVLEPALRAYLAEHPATELPATEPPTDESEPPIAALLEAGVVQLDRAVAAAREIARQSAVMVDALAEFAACRPRSVFDRQPGERGAMSTAVRAARPAALAEVTEWAVDEIALALQITTTQAATRLGQALTLSTKLPATLGRHREGTLSPAHVTKLVDHVAPVADDTLRAEIEERVLQLQGHKTPPQLGECARRIALRRDAEAAGRRLVTAIRERKVRLFEHADGTATVSITLSLPVAAAIYRSLEAYADQLRTDADGTRDERTKTQRMADVVADLILQPGQHGMAPVTIALTLVATLETMLGGDATGTVDGHVVSADQVRELAYTFGLLPRPSPDLDHPDDPGDPDGEHPGNAQRNTRQPDCESADTQAGDTPPGREFAPTTSDEEPNPTPTPTSVRRRRLAEWIDLLRREQLAALRAATPGLGRALRTGTIPTGTAVPFSPVTSPGTSPGT